MNDDFIKRHRQRPDPKFVEHLYQQINITPKRSFSMYKRPVLITSLALVLIVALTFAFSPAARAAVQDIFTLNGASVSIDDETGKLVVSGNPDAIVEQSDYEVSLKGNNGEYASVAVAQVDGEMLDVSELLNRYPDLILPIVPVGYTLQSQGQLTSDGTVVITWMDAAENIITYERSANPFAEFDQVIGSDGNPLSPYAWEAGGFYHMLTATDSSLDSAELQSMLP